MLFSQIWNYRKNYNKLILRSSRLILFHFVTSRYALSLSLHWRMSFFSYCFVKERHEFCEPWKWLLQVFEYFMWNVPFNKMLSLILFVFVKTSDHEKCAIFFGISHSFRYFACLFVSQFFIFYHFIKYIYEMEKKNSLSLCIAM